MQKSMAGANRKLLRLPNFVRNMSFLVSRPFDDRSSLSRTFWVLAAYLVLAFLLGGGSRWDVQSLVVLRPLAALTCGIALLTLTRDEVRDHRFLFIFAALVIAVCAIHLVPLPPSVWQTLPGREVIIAIDSAAGIQDHWRPLTMAPAAGHNALFSLLVPLAALLLVVQLPTPHLRRLVAPLLVIGGISGLLGIAQVAGDPNGGLYLYRITNNGSAVGLFSNRNHQAVLLASMIPIIALFASAPMKTDGAIKLRLALACGAALLTLPLILVTGSRLGLVVGIVGLLTGWLVFRRPVATGARQRTERRDHSPLIIGLIGTFLLSLVGLLALRSEAIKRLTATSVGEEDRSEAWTIVVRLANEHLPFGSGSGSFVPLYQMAEPIESLSPVYFNHAHNDWLEIWMTFGIPGILLMAAASSAYILGVRSLWKRRKEADEEQLQARAGASIVFIFALASMVDYPLRTPSLACFFVIACVWLVRGLRMAKISTGALAPD